MLEAAPIGAGTEARLTGDVIFAGTSVIFCWHRLVLLLQSDLLDFCCYGFLLELVSNFAGTGVVPLLQSNLLDFCCYGFLLEPVSNFAGTGFQFCFN